MTVHVFRSTDTGAPSLTGQVGSGITVLDALLVNGYNTQSSIAIARVSTTATVTKTAHGYNNLQAVQISGADQAEYNGVFRITNVTANTFDYTVAGSPATPATGTISAKVAPAGWTKTYSGTNKGVYRGPAGSTQLYFRADDTEGQQFRIRGYETMSDVDTGTGAFPSVAQLANPPHLYKSSAASATARDWVAVSNGKVVWLFSNYTGSGTGNMASVTFGDIVSRKSGDLYHAVVMGSTGVSSTALEQCLHQSHGDTVIGGHYIARAYTQLGSSLAIGKTTDTGLIESSSNNVMGSTGLTYPNSTDGGFYIAPIRIIEPAMVYRGDMTGIWNVCHSRPLSHLDEFDGQGSYSSKRFIALNAFSSGQILIEVSNTW